MRTRDAADGEGGTPTSIRVVALSKRMSAARVRGAMDASVNVAVDALVGMSQTPGDESAIIEGGEKTRRPD